MNYLRESSQQLQDSVLDPAGASPSSFFVEPRFCLRQHCAQLKYLISQLPLQVGLVILA